MTGDGRTPVPAALRRLGSRRDLQALALVTAAYLAFFAATRQPDIGTLLETTARNVVPLAITAAVARPWVRRVLRLRPAPGLVLHVGLAVVFSLLWLWLLTLAGALLGGSSVMRFVVNPFLEGPAADWQVFQGLFVYALLACLCALDQPGREATVVLVDGPVATTPHLVRDGDTLAPLALTRLVCIRGADDYSELLTLDGVQLVATRLGAFEALLDPLRFVRVHRSAIINLDHLQRAEPAGGGRLILHMTAGPPIAASRAGARALRARAL